ncbi:MAG: hypothetical protein GXO04_06485 [Aquificae bacterium]|nr:hypothetical protein [Aquificota bacterium]
MRVLIFVLLWVFLVFGVEGFIVEEVNVSEGLGLKRELKRRVYITSDALITETPKEFMVQKIENGIPKIYRVIKSTKSYMDFSKSAPLFLVSLPFIDCTNKRCVLRKEAFKPTDEWALIGNYKARKVIVDASFMGRKNKLIQWYTKEWKELVEANKLENTFYVNFIKAIMKERNLTEENVPVSEIKAFLDEITKKFGGVIRTEQDTTLFHTYTQVISVKKAQIPDYIYRLPEGYQRIR